MEYFRIHLCKSFNVVKINGKKYHVQFTVRSIFIITVILELVDFNSVFQLETKSGPALKNILVTYY